MTCALSLCVELLEATAAVAAAAAAAAATARERERQRERERDRERERESERASERAREGGRGREGGREGEREKERGGRERERQRFWTKPSILCQKRPVRVLRPHVQSNTSKAEIFTSRDTSKGTRAKMQKEEPGSLNFLFKFQE